ncbi:MAG: tripartite tricarboxylate transporter permease [Thermofilum sp.]
MDPFTILLVMALSALSTILYIFIGILPGTDETTTMAPVLLTLLLAGVDPLLVLVRFVASIAAFKIADNIQVALAGIPGGVMAVPQVPDALTRELFRIGVKVIPTDAKARHRPDEKPRRKGGGEAKESRESGK